MIHHAMRYVQMSQNLRADLGAEHPLTQNLRHAEDQLVEAESGLVEAYGNFRELLTHATVAGSTRAAEYLERTTWDLT